MVLHIANAIRGRGRNIRRDHHAYDYGTFRHQIYLQSSEFKVQFRFATEPGSFLSQLRGRRQSTIAVTAIICCMCVAIMRLIAIAVRASFLLRVWDEPGSPDSSDLAFRGVRMQVTWEADLPYIRTSSHHGRVVQV